MVMRIHYGVVPAGQQELALPATPRLLGDVNVQDAAGLLRLLQEERAMTEGSTAWVKVPTSLGPRWEKLKHSSALPAAVDLEMVIELGAAAAGAAASVAVPLPVCVPVELPDQKVDDAFGRVSRLKDRDGNTIGTCVRIYGNVILGPRHCIVSEGRCLSELEAFGGQLTFVAARADLDVVAFRGPPGSSFTLLGTELLRGMPVSLLSFPQAYDNELSCTSGPALDSGVVSQISETGRHAVATFGTGMPNSSGGAVVSSTRTLVGLYTGILWHLEEVTSSSGSSGGGSSSGGSSSNGSVRPPAALERNPAEMWEDPEEAGVVEAAAASDTVAAQLSRVNIQHKNSAGMFIPAAALLRFMQAAHVAPNAPLDAACDKVARELRPRRSKRHKGGA